MTNPLIQTCESPGSQTLSAQLRALHLGLDRIRGPRLAYFDDNGKPPPSLYQYALQLESLADDKQLLWPDLQIEVTHHPLKATLFRRLANPIWYTLSPSPHSGPTPSCADLQDLVTAARECESNHASEAHWNWAVHYPVLDLPLEPHLPRLRAANCTDVPISTEYHALQGPLLSSHHAVTSNNVNCCIVLTQSGV